MKLAAVTEKKKSARMKDEEDSLTGLTIINISVISAVRRENRSELRNHVCNT